LLFELFIFIKQPKNNTIYSGSYHSNETATGEKEFLGYGPKEDSSFSVSLIRKNDKVLVFDALYSFKDGLRTTKNNNTSSNHHISLVGGSHIFGEGLNENQTIAHYLNHFSDNAYNISNYGFNGYGTHQALNVLERKPINNSVVIYYFITDHISRAAGKALWDIKGPCYEFENDSITFKGSFDDNKLIKENKISKLLKTIWRHSHFYKSFFDNQYHEKDIIRTKEMIKKMNRIATKNNTRFILLIRDHKDKNLTKKLNELLYTPLKKSNIEYYYTNEIITDLATNLNDYIIIGDGHPNEKYNKKIAEFLNNKIHQQQND